MTRPWRRDRTCLGFNRQPVVFAINENENGMETRPERLQTAGPTDSAPVSVGWRTGLASAPSALHLAKFPNGIEVLRRTGQFFVVNALSIAKVMSR